jgi:DNA-binding transcriptional LysR family regulator
MKVHPKVSVFVEPTDRSVNVIEERFDIAIRAKPVIEDVAGLVAKTLGNSQRVLVVSPAFLDRYGRPQNPADLARFDTVASIDDTFDGGARWNLSNLAARTEQIRTEAKARHERSAREIASGHTRHWDRVAARTSGYCPVKRGAHSASVVGMVGGEEYPPPGFPDTARHASVGKESY